MKTRSTLLVTLLLLLTSCGADSSKETLSITRMETITNDISVEYNGEKEELSVGDIIIKPGISDNFPKNLSIYKNAKTYINSNVNNYLYFIIYDGTIAETIGEYYIDSLEKLNYTRLNNEFIEQIDIEEDLSNKINYLNLEYAIKNSDYIIPEDRVSYLTNNSEGFTKNIDDEYLDTIQIYIKDKVPEAIKDGTGIEGVFVEIYY